MHKYNKKNLLASIVSKENKNIFLCEHVCATEYTKLHLSTAIKVARQCVVACFYENSLSGNNIGAMRLQMYRSEASHAPPA